VIVNFLLYFSAF